MYKMIMVAFYEIHLLTLNCYRLSYSLIVMNWNNLDSRGVLWHGELGETVKKNCSTNLESMGTVAFFFSKISIIGCMFMYMYIEITNYLKPVIWLWVNRD